MSRMNARITAVRPAMLAIALLLAAIATISPAMAACSSGSTRTIVTNIACCAPAPQVKVTKQNQVCSGGVWVNSGNSYCGSNSACATP